MNNEPVAECCDDGEGGVYYKTLANKAPIGKLYTHPADLTDEEIWEVRNSIYPTGLLPAQFQLDFARAILRKAQEK